jgi:hypothetical protein
VVVIGIDKPNKLRIAAGLAADLEIIKGVEGGQ